MPLDLQPLIDETAETIGAENSAIVALDGFMAKVEEANAVSQGRVNEVIAQFKAKREELLAAIARNPGA